MEQEFKKIFDDIKRKLSSDPVGDLSPYPQWKRVDWLGSALVKVATKNGDKELLSIIRDFYETGEISKRISTLFGHYKESRSGLTKCDTQHLLILSEYLRHRNTRRSCRM
ncbi:hypothetical protein BdWA1_003291 [Babesia duncani]|uniref:Uncharacterized protein n=1 Tax=Babesia duncani TaxID=323732 RepID=A0AAD9PJN5_9APIC|nr:hypothetical protein BdWA1_003291 [Babesia duncani]